MSLKEKQTENFEEENFDYFIEFYNDISLEQLKNIFAICHSSLNYSFSFMNNKNHGNGGHFNAHQSRALKSIIDFIKDLEKILKSHNSVWAFDIDQYYKNVFMLCEEFLIESGGSPIPENFPKIELIEHKPIFWIENKIIFNNHPYESTHLKEVSSGSYALVYKYKDPTYRSQVALKRAFKNLNEKELERFKLEYETLKKLDSPLIIKAYKYYEQKNEYLMELADYTLEHYIHLNKDKISIGRKITLVKQVLRAFEYIYSKNLLHRDISYKNILIKEHEDHSIFIKVADFGLVKDPSSNLTSIGTDVKGSINDKSDLSLVGYENYEIRHETYALSQVIYFILTGRTSRYYREKNEALLSFINKGTAPKNERYQNLGELNTAVNQLIKNL